jgi:hypothetical protein
MKKVAVYSILFGNYDQFLEPLYHDEDFDYFLFTDQEVNSDIYTIIPRKTTGDNIRDQREIKINSCKYFGDYDYTIYHDANITQFMPLKGLLDSMHTDLAVMKHPMRSCVYAEYEACCVQSKDDPEVMNRQVQRYMDEEFKANSGMVATGVLFRKTSDIVRAFEGRWWHEVDNGSIRDQLSFNYCLNGLKIDLFPWTILTTHFIINKHKS